MIILAAFTVRGQAPNDCINAVGVCSNGVINENSNGPGFNDFASGANASGCLLGLEHQSVWLYIQIASGDHLGFSITPVGGFGQDYDFAVFGPNRPCNDLGSPIRCSWADAFCSYCPATGLNSTSNDLSESGNGDGFVRWLDVNPGETYYILVDNYNASSTGFTLNWTGDAVLDCSVTMDCPVVDLGNDILLCPGGSTVIGVPAGTGESYLWSTGQTSREISVASAGTYWLEVTRDGCTVRDEVQVFIDQSSSVNLGADISICSNSIPYTITAQATGNGNQFVWQDGSTGPEYAVTASGTYWVEVSNGNCTVRDSIFVSVQPVPVFDLGPDAAVCGGSEFTLDASTTPVSDYTWQDGSTGPTFTVTSSGTYTATASNPGCSFTDSIHIEVLQTPDIDLGNDTALCSGEVLELDLSAANAQTYLWQDGSTEDHMTITQGGTYYLTASIAQCSVTDTLLVEVFNTPAFELGPDTSLCSGSALLLSALSPFAVSYTWQDGSDSPGFAVGSSGSFSATAYNAGCSYSDTINVIVHPAPQIDLGEAADLCAGEELLLDASNSGAVDLQWQDGSQGPDFTVSTSGIYWIEASNEFCTVIDSIEVQVHQRPVFDIGLDSAAQQVPLLLCDGDAVMLDIHSPFATNYQWQDGTGSPLYQATQTGWYIGMASNAGCSYSDSVRLTFNPAPSIDLGRDTSLCAGSPVELNASSPMATGYIWQDGSTGASLTVTNSGTYHVLVAANNCYDRDTIEIQFLEVPQIDLGPDTSICEGSALFLDAFHPAATDYQWQDGSSDASFLADESGIYSVLVSNGNCRVSDGMEVEVLEFPQFSLGEDRSLCGIEGITLYAPQLDGADFTWHDGSTAPAIRITDEGIVFLTVDTYCGTVVDSIVVSREDCACNIVFPTGFSPNGDNHNDAFYPFINCENLLSFEWEIFNRWGERIFASDDTEAEWRPNANDVFEMDTYIWTVSFSYEKDGEVRNDVVSGSVLLLK